jgi:primosomal protein N'
MKSIGKYKIWNKWSKKSEKYNQNENNKIWNSIKLTFDENYLKYLCNLEEDIHKKYIPLTKDLKFDVKKINSKYLNTGISYTELNKYNTIILKSSTGTGKTTMTAQMIKKELEKDKSKRILSIVSKISLSNQQIKSFMDEDIELVSYRDTKKDIKIDNMVCCLNSLWMYQYISNNEMKNMIIYIDEVKSNLSYINEINK